MPFLAGLIYLPFIWCLISVLMTLSIFLHKESKNLQFYYSCYPNKRESIFGQNSTNAYTLSWLVNLFTDQL